MRSHNRRAIQSPTELEVGAHRTLCIQDAPVRQLVALVRGHAVAIVDGYLHHSLAPISVVGWPEVMTTSHASATVVTTSDASLLVFTPVECVDLFGVDASPETVLSTLNELVAQPH